MQLNHDRAILDILHYKSPCCNEKSFVRKVILSVFMNIDVEPYNEGFSSESDTLLVKWFDPYVAIFLFLAILR